MLFTIASSMLVKESQQSARISNVLHALDFATDDAGK